MKNKITNKNIIYMLIISICFFWSGSAFLSQNVILSRLTNNSNFISNGIGSLFRAFGIFLFVILYKKRNEQKLKIIYIFTLLLSIVFSILFWQINSISIKIIIHLLLCIGGAGFCIGYNFSLFSNNVDRNNIGKYFGISYALGSLGTYLITIIPKIDCYTSIKSLIIFIPCIIINMYLIYKYGKFRNYKDEQEKVSKKSILNLVVIIIIMSLLYSYASSILNAIIVNHNKNIPLLRIFSSLGLVIAGLIFDKSKKNGEMLTILSLIFPLVICIFNKEGISVNILYSMLYTISGFFTIFTTYIFMQISSANEKYISIAALGYGIVRIFDFLMITILNRGLSNYLIIIVLLTLIFILLIVYYFYKYDEKKDYKSIRKNKINDFCYSNNLTTREKEILKQLLDEKYSKEIAADLYITEGTVKNTLTRIYKKTNMNRKQILNELNN